MRKWCGTGGFVARGREGCGGVCVTLGADVTVDKEQWVNETARRRPTCLTTPAPGTSSLACPLGCDARRHSIRLEGAGEQRRTGSIVRLYTAADQFTKRHRPQADHGHYLWWSWCCAWCSLPFVAGIATAGRAARFPDHVKGMSRARRSANMRLLQRSRLRPPPHVPGQPRGPRP